MTTAELNKMGERARRAAYELQTMKQQDKEIELLKCAEYLSIYKEEILAANAEDIKRATENGMHPGMIDRLRLDDARIEAMAEGMRQVVKLKDPCGEVMEEFTRPNGLKIRKVRVPIGVIGIIYESRPNVTADAFALTFKSGNAVILKGGSDAISSNIAIVNLMRKSLTSSGLNPDFVQLIEDTDRKVTQAFMKLNKYVDVLIPRGGAGLIKSVVEKSTIPVIETGTGNCHIYVDKYADLDKAVPIIVNAKTQRIGVCNACESLVVHKEVARQLMPRLAELFKEFQVEIRGDEYACDILPEAVPATKDDWGKEYLDYIVSMKTVGSVEEAVEHINRYNTRHSEAIITEDKTTAQYFMDRVDAACVYVNASTRFTDGFEFGFGAEIGISTQKLHARGPMGLKELTSYKYQIYGNGQIRT
ncbi:MAG: glutamate-5-semialdehyde dehydrogenase [Lachnospiraceae bacterium]|nr:glutamate-5-semialdehyde dehydrogenase [Lachnospiraceae bacterium]